MTAPSRLLGLSNERFGRPQKTPVWAKSASLTLLTTYAPFITWADGVEVANGGQWLDVGNAPGIHVVVQFTHGATPTTITLLGVCANPLLGAEGADPTIGAPTPYIPSVAGAGLTPAYPNAVPFTKTDWAETISPLGSSTVKQMGGYLRANGCRYMSVYALVNSVTNAPTAVAYVVAGCDG